jgi:hypothetical protein
MQFDKKWAIRLAWMIGGMCCGVLISTNDEELTAMMDVCPECECTEAEAEVDPLEEALEEVTEEEDNTPASQPENEPTEETQVESESE